MSTASGGVCDLCVGDGVAGGVEVWVAGVADDVAVGVAAGGVPGTVGVAVGDGAAGGGRGDPKVAPGVEITG